MLGMSSSMTSLVLIIWGGFAAIVITNVTNALRDVRVARWQLPVEAPVTEEETEGEDVHP